MKAIKWINDVVKPTKNKGKYYQLFMMKCDLENDTGEYLTEDEFRQLLEDIGVPMVEEDIYFLSEKKYEEGRAKWNTM